MARRGHGEGTIYKRADGRWSAQITLSTTGKRRTLYARTRRQVAEKLAEFQADPDRAATPVAGTVGEFLARWLDTASASLRPTTMATYHSLVRCQILPHLGDTRLSKRLR